MDAFNYYKSACFYIYPRAYIDLITETKHNHMRTSGSKRSSAIMSCPFNLSHSELSERVPKVQPQKMFKKGHHVTEACVRRASIHYLSKNRQID